MAIWREPGYGQYLSARAAPFWRKADPDPLPVVSAPGLDLTYMRRKILTYCRIEAGLIRQRKRLCQEM